MSSLAEASSPYPAVARRHVRVDERVYRELTAFCFDEAICFPSQVTIARRLRMCRQAVNESIQRMVERGWITVTKVRRGTWDHNVYELLKPYAVSDLAAKRITRRAHHRSPIAPSLISVGVSRWVCRCRHCQADRTRTRRPRRPDWATANDRKRGLLVFHDLMVDQMKRREQSASVEPARNGHTVS